MNIYQGKLRLSGSLFNELMKDDMTAAEIVVLKRLHGSDALLDIKHVRVDNRTDETERARLNEIYGMAARKDERLKSLDTILGVEGVPLPQSVPGVDKPEALITGKRAKKVAPVVEEEADEITQAEFA